MVDFLQLATILLCIGSIFAGFANTGCQYMRITGLESSDDPGVKLFIALLKLWLPDDSITDEQAVGLWSFKSMTGPNKGTCYWFNETADFSPSYRAAQVFGAICNACYWAIFIILLATICCKRCQTGPVIMFVYFLFVVTFFCCCFTFLIFNSDVCKTDGISCELDVGGGLNIGAVLSLFLAICLMKMGMKQRMEAAGVDREIDAPEEEDVAEDKDVEKDAEEPTPEQPVEEQEAN
eukprot:CAMPEP_0194026248 /NCGR_PEP_ID=MMETSP0009_2-20130614/567_1 /TAXON_ID=210454 /ORGANISM="Grammatophora oceanica, Strain CCMP 410" /LENGTH=235 /DNA_ID=CAMNT_0038664831 /DNA_START=66 /DNA_END=773 /DNA_ORIENTATION=-